MFDGIGPFVRFDVIVSVFFPTYYMQQICNDQNVFNLTFIGIKICVHVTNIMVDFINNTFFICIFFC